MKVSEPRRENAPKIKKRVIHQEKPAERERAALSESPKDEKRTKPNGE